MKTTNFRETLHLIPTPSCTSNSVLSKKLIRVFRNNRSNYITQEECTIKLGRTVSFLNIASGNFFLPAVDRYMVTLFLLVMLYIGVQIYAIFQVYLCSFTKTNFWFLFSLEQRRQCFSRFAPSKSLPEGKTSSSTHSSFFANNPSLKVLSNGARGGPKLVSIDPF
jgi:hypothetical protein